MMLAVAVAGVIALAGWWYSGDRKARRVLAAAPRRAVVDVAEGEFVRVVGTVEVERPVDAPLSGRECAHWRVIVEDFSVNDHEGSRMVDEHDGVDFFVREEGGDRALVSTRLIQALLEDESERRSGPRAAATPEVEAFLLGRAKKSRGWIFNKSLRCRETVARPGATVAVVGVARWERDPTEEASAGAGYREAHMPMRLVLEGPDGGALLLSDEPEFTR